MKNLERIRLPFATKHILDNSMFSVNNSILSREVRHDDQFICLEQQESEDIEPIPVQKDFHVPKNSKVNIKTNLAATPTELSIQTRQTSSQRSSRLPVGLSKRTSGNVLRSQSKKRSVKKLEEDKKANNKDLSEKKLNELALSDLSVSKDFN